jgi:hypothetical protein
MAGKQFTDAAPAVLSADRMGCLRTLVVITLDTYYLLYHLRVRSSEFGEGLQQRYADLPGGTDRLPSPTRINSSVILSVHPCRLGIQRKMAQALQYPAVRYVGVKAVTSTTGGLHVNQSVPALGTES